MGSTLLSSIAKDPALANLDRWQMAAALAAGRHADAVEAARRSGRQRHDPELRAQEAESLLPLLRFAESLSLTALALEAAPGGDTEARLRIVRAQGFFMTGRAGAAWSELRRAEALAGSDLNRGACAEIEAFFHCREQRPDAARECTRRAWKHYAACGSPEGLGRALEKEAAVLRSAGCFDEALEVLGHRLSIASCSTRLDLMAEARMDRGDLLAFVGRWSEARVDFDGAINLFQELKDPREHALARPRRAMIDLARGALDSVREALRLAREGAEAGSSPWFLAEHALLTSDLELAAGSPELADRAAEEALSLFSILRSAEGECRSRSRRAHALVGLGRHEPALQQARRAVLAATETRPDLCALASLAEGRVLLRLDREAAAACFGRARGNALTRRGLAAAADLGACLAHGSGPDETKLQRALTALEEWGDQRLVALARADVETLTGRSSQAEPSGAAPRVLRFPDIVGRSDSMLVLFEQMSRAAGSSLAVHVFGETGTGKERVALALHRHSPFSRGAFVAVNAASLSDELFESELFGHVRGAFTGAVADRRGHVAEADGGTLFIDEVSDLTARGQAKLLRFLQSGEYRRVGETETRRARVRVVSAANVRLTEQVREGRFREDLFYRLAGLSLTLPPLRERGEDVIELARHFLKTAAERESVACPALGSEIAAELRRHHWPGNIRELENVVNQLVVMAAGGPLRREHLVIAARTARLQSDLRAGRAVFERDLIARTLSQYGGNRTRAAGALGITRQGLLLKIRQYALG